MVLETTRRKRGKQLLRLQHCKGAGLSQSCNVPFRQVVNNIKVFAGCRWLFSKSAPASQGAQNLLAGCIFDRLACQKCFCVTLDKSNRTSSSQVPYRSQSRKLDFSLTSLLVLSTKSHAMLPTFCRIKI